jgi:hypothetical protein
MTFTLCISGPRVSRRVFAFMVGWLDICSLAPFALDVMFS